VLVVLYCLSFGTQGPIFLGVLGLSVDLG
jgi:hypothetical protein